MDKIRLAAREVRTGGQAIIFSSPTGSGKTVMATSAIERIFEGDTESLPDPEAVVLWLSDQPEINEQTRRKMLGTSSLLDTSRLVVVDASFDSEVFPPGKVHFLNTQKLGKDKQLVTHGDPRTFTIWETINNTARLHPDNFFMFIDEAHRGMMPSQREQNEANTIVQKFIIGSEGEVDPVPIVIGISATPEKFRHLLQSTSRTQRFVDVLPEDVRASGLLVDAVRFFYPSEKQPTDITMLQAAANSWKEFAEHWKKYCLSQKEKILKPILVVQVQDGSAGKISDTNLEEAVSVINETVGQLPPDAFAHSFQEGTEVEVGTLRVRYVSPADINSDPDVAVVFFKMSLNTGWDCPRAEVMMSFRKAVDSTLIAQLVGRMVRTPLARRIESDELLDTVTLYLPHYDEVGLRNVVDRLRSPDADMPPVTIEEGGAAVTLVRRKGSEREFEALAQVPSYSIPRPLKTKGVRRLMKLARLLANDNIKSDAIEQATKSLLSLLQSEYDRLSDKREFQSIVEDKGKVKVNSVDWRVMGEAGGGETIVLDIAKQNLDDLFGAAGRKLGEGLHKAWWKYRADRDDALRTTAKLETVAFCIMPNVLSKLEKNSQELARKWLDSYRSEINELVEDRKQHYVEVRGLASEPELEPLIYPPQITVRRGSKLFKNHLYVDEQGLFPADADNWESKIIEDDFQSITGWLRNLDRKSWSLTIPYKVGGVFKGFYPDFLGARVVKDRIVIDLVDPHHTNLADAVPKAVGLASYAAQHSHQFGRIELVRLVGVKVQRLDLKNEEVRSDVLGLTTKEQLERFYDKYN